MEVGKFDNLIKNFLPAYTLIAITFVHYVIFQDRNTFVSIAMVLASPDIVSASFCFFFFMAAFSLDATQRDQWRTVASAIFLVVLFLCMKQKQVEISAVTWADFYDSDIYLNFGFIFSTIASCGVIFFTLSFYKKYYCGRR